MNKFKLWLYLGLGFFSLVFAVIEIFAGNTAGGIAWCAMSFASTNTVDIMRLQAKEK